MQDDDPWRIEGHHFPEPYADSAVDFLCGFVGSEWQLIELVSQYFLQLIQLQVVSIDEQLSLLLAVLLEIGVSDGWFIVVKQEVSVGQYACLLQAISLDSIIWKAAYYYSLVDVVHLVDFGYHALADYLRVQEVVVLPSEEKRYVDETEVVLIGQSSGQSGPPFLFIPLDADHHLGISVLQVLDEEANGVIRPCEEQSLGEFAEEGAQLVFLAIGLHVLVSFESLFSVHCSYISWVQSATIYKIKSPSFPANAAGCRPSTTSFSHEERIARERIAMFA